MTFKQNKFKNLWEFFDGQIYCINLKTRDDRYESSRKVFNQYDIPVKYFRVDKHPKGGAYGCFDSHIKVIRKAYYEGANRVLIFEDDISPTDYLTPKRLETAINFMENEDWDLFYLGALPNIRSYKSYSTSYPGIYRLRGICTHAYIINRKTMKKLINLKYNGTAIDYYYIHNFNKSYAVYPTLFFQGLSESDIGYNWWAKYGTKERVSTFYRCMEGYAYYIQYPLILFVPLILLVLAWFCTGMYKNYSPLVLVGIIVILILIVLCMWRDNPVHDKNNFNNNIKKYK